MKKNYFLLLLVAATAALTSLTACQDLDANPSPYSDYAVVSANFNVADIIKNYTFRTTADEMVSISVNAPFDTRIDPEYDDKGKKVPDSLARWILNNFGKCNGGVIALRTTKNLTDQFLGNYTKDLELLVYETGKRHVEGIYNIFAFPVRIRQTGTDGTYYMTPEQVKQWKSTPSTIVNQILDNGLDDGSLYVKGTVKEMGSKGVETKKPGADGSWSAPWAIEGVHFVARDFDYLEMVIDVNGVEIPMRLEYMSDYKLFSNFKVNVGDTVEVCFRKAGATVKPGTYVCSPLDVFKM